MFRKRSGSRRVARAAATGGGRTSRGRTPILWYGSLSLVVVLGLVGIVFSRYQRQHPSNAASVAPTLKDHWNAAFAFDICGALQPNPPKSPNASKTGINTQGDGLIHVAPRSSADTGHNATLGRFVRLYPGMKLSSTGLRYPGKKAWSNGDRCGTTPGQVQVKVWSSLADRTGHVVAGNPDNLLLENGQLITIAFVPKGHPVPKPPSAANVANASAAQSTPAPTGNGSSSASTPPATSGSSPTAKPGSSGPATTGPPASSPSTTAKGASSSGR